MSFLLGLYEAGDEVDELDAHELRADFRRFRDELVELGALEEFHEGNKLQGYVVGVGQIPKVEQAICSLDPFSYLSHLTAMAWHGLTDRIPKTIFLTRPSESLWRRLSDARLKSQLDHLFSVYQSAKLPGYHRLKLQKLNRRPLNIWSSTRLDRAYQAAYKRVEDGELRMATTGRCFLDMVREPELCGGIYHVMEVFGDHGVLHSEKILNELEQHGNKLERARVGYLLEEASPDLKSHPILEKWASSVTRGGSRKLDPSGDYSDEYSERWALSINV